jgi:hypothetical protein
MQASADSVFGVVLVMAEHSFSPSKTLAGMLE